MKYKPGDKFIIEIERCIENCAPPNYRMKKCFFSLSETSLCNLEPYSKEAEYQRGLDDAWAAAEKVASLEGSVQVDLFGSYMDKQVFRDHTPQEAIAKLRAYEEAHEIHVGDEVKLIETPWVVTSVDAETRKAFGMTQRGKFCGGNLNDLKKTGRHFPEVAALLEKMKDNADV